MTKRKRRHLHLVGKNDKAKDRDLSAVFGCPHFDRLVDDIVKNRISEEEAEQERRRLGRHSIGGDGVSVLLCTECFQKGNFVYWEGCKGQKCRLVWPILERVK